MLTILEYPDKRLLQVCKPVTAFDAPLRDLVQNLFALLKHHEGVGLAAIQVGVPLRLFVMDCSYHQNEPMCLINPQITHKEGLGESEEGCLSLPGIYLKINRATTVTVDYQDVDGKKQTLTKNGLDAFCIQHETEHLDGILNISHLSKLKRAMVLKKMQKYLKIKRIA